VHAHDSTSLASAAAAAEATTAPFGGSADNSDGRGGGSHFRSILSVRDRPAVAAAATAGDAPAASLAQSRYKAALWRLPVEWAPPTTHEAHLRARLCAEDGGLPLLRYRLAVELKGHGGAFE